MPELMDVVVIGAGQAGLAVSYLLLKDGINHLVLERGLIGESWRSQRWDSFHLNTPNWSNGLIGMEFQPDAPSGFGHRDEMVTYLEEYVETHGLPVREQANVLSIEANADGKYQVTMEDESFLARSIVLATGAMSQPRVPEMARQLPRDIVSLSAGTYRNADLLPQGAVLVVGTGQSGCQIAEDLLETGRTVYVSASHAGRVPRTYRGREILEWWRDMGFMEVKLEQLEDPAMQFATQPQVSGTRGGHTVSLQSLARDGATLLGRVTAIQGYDLSIKDDLLECIEFGDQKAKAFKDAVDHFIEQQGIDAAPATPDPGEPPLPDLNGSDRIRVLDLQAVDVKSIIWCTGFEADWSWVKLDAFDAGGRPRHQGGITDLRGLYFVGFPWLSSRKSGILYGVSDDADRIVRHLKRHALEL